MARLVSQIRRLFWDASTSANVVDYIVYAGDAAQTDFLAAVDAGTVAELARTGGALEYQADMPDGTHQFAVCAVDSVGHISDPYQHPAWASVPFSKTPPAPPSGGGLESV